jgi:hypothetical protein
MVTMCTQGTRSACLRSEDLEDPQLEPALPGQKCPWLPAGTGVARFGAMSLGPGPDPQQEQRGVVLGELLILALSTEWSGISSLRGLQLTDNTRPAVRLLTMSIPQ